MALTRDYKKRDRHSFDPARFKEFGMGLMVGAVLAGGAFAYFKAPQKPAAEAAPKPEPQRTAPADPEPGAPAENRENYDFYEMLPKFEVVVPEKEKDVKRDLPTTKVDRPGVYVLQVGSYRNQADADRVQAQLKVQGIDAQVQRVAVDNDVWHRVRIGPVSDLNELNRLRQQLHAADKEGIVIRVGD